MSEQITTPTEETIPNEQTQMPVEQMDVQVQKPTTEEQSSAEPSEEPVAESTNESEVLPKSQSETEAEDNITTEDSDDNLKDQDPELLGNPPTTEEQSSADSFQKTIDNLNHSEQATLLGEIKSHLATSHANSVKGSLVIDSVMRVVTKKLNFGEREREEVDKLQAAIVASANQQKFLDLVSKFQSCIDNPSYKDASRLSMIGESIDIYLGKLG